MIQHFLSMEVAITAAVGLRADFTATDLQRLAQSQRDVGQVRRLLALAVIYDGGSRSEAARTGGLGLQTVHDWVLRVNIDGVDGPKLSGDRPRYNAHQRAALSAAVESGPIPAAHGVVRWHLVDFAQGIRDEFTVTISTQTLSRALRAQRWGYRKLTARPRHNALATDNIDVLKKDVPAQMAAIKATLPAGRLSNFGGRTRCGSARRMYPSTDDRLVGQEQARS